MTDHQAQIQQFLNAIPGFDTLSAADYSSTRLGGMTNLVFSIETATGDYVLRIPGKGTEEYIDRAVEIHNARVAARAGVSAEVVFADVDSGIMLTRYVDDCVTMTPAAFAERPGSPTRAGLALKRMHEWPEAFEFRFELFSMIDDYLGILAGRDTNLPPGYADVVEAAQPVRIALDRRPAKLAPCHCDPLCENFLDTDLRMWIVDWEYSGMNDPLWDLGDLSVEAGFTQAQDMEMMLAWCAGEPTASELGRMVIYKAMCDLLWTLWGLIQHSDGNPAEDFWVYSLTRFERCKALMASAEFDRHVAAVDRDR